MFPPLDLFLLPGYILHPQKLENRFHEEDSFKDKQSTAFSGEESIKAKRMTHCCQWCASTLCPTFAHADIMFLKEEILLAFESYRRSIRKNSQPSTHLTLVDLRQAAGHYRVYYRQNRELHQFYFDVCEILDQLIKEGNE